MHDPEHEERPHQKHQHGVAVDSISQAFPPRGLLVLVDRHHPDVAHAPPVQIAGRGMMHCVFGPPELVRREGQDARDESHDLIRGARRQERTMPAVVEDDERADEERRRQHRDAEGQPVGHLQGEEHEDPESQTRDERVDELPDGLGRIGPRVFVQNLAHSW